MGTMTTRPYKDGDDASQNQHALNRNTGDSVAVTQMGNELTFAASPNVLDDVTDPTVSAAISVAKFEDVILKVETSNSGPTVKLRIWRIDSTGNAYVPGEKITVKNTGVQGTTALPTLKSNYFHAEAVVVKTWGAASIKVELVNNPGGDVSVWAVGR